MVDVAAAAPNGLAAVGKIATGSFTSAGNAVAIQLGFNPQYVRVFDEAGGIIWEKVQGDLPPNSWKSGALDTTGAVMFPADVGLNAAGASVLLSAAVVGTGKVISWVVFGS